MGTIVLSRVDSRLIHGQVMTKWLQQSQANKIVVVSEELANDEFMRDIYLMSAPEGIKIDCLSEKDAVTKLTNLESDNSKILVLFPNLQTVLNIVENGVNIESLQIGGLGGAPNRKVVFQNITLDDDDVNILKNLINKKCNVYFQIIPEDNPQSAQSIIDKY